MSYSTPALVRKALLPSSDGTLPAPPSNTAADLSDVQLQDAIDEADSFIDSMIGRFYATPVAQVAGATPHPLDYWSRNIAAYNAYLGFRKGQDFSDDDPVFRRYTATMQALQAVNTGTASLNPVSSFPGNTTDSRAAGASPAYNQYQGDLWVPADFEIGSPRQNWPTGTPGGW
jgi:phage gp36-like protein